MKVNKWISRKEAAQMLGVHPQTISNYVKAGVIHSRGQKGEIHVVKDEIEFLGLTAIHDVEEMREKTAAYEAEIKEKYTVSEKMMKQARAEFYKVFRDRESWNRYKKVIETVVDVIAGETLTERGREIIGKVLDCEDMRDIEKEIGVTRIRVNEIINKALRQMLQFPSKIERMKEEKDALRHQIEVLKDEKAMLTYNLEAAKHPEFFPKERANQEKIKIVELLKAPLSDYGLSVRAYNCLKAADIHTFADLVSYTRPQLMKFRNFGRKSLNEIDLLVEKMGLCFGMDVAKYL